MLSVQPVFRLAVAQAPADLNSPTDRLDWLRSILPDIANSGADLLLLPELFACGYNIGDAIRTRAEIADGPTFAAIADMAHEAGVAIHYGFAERSEDALYNAALCVSADRTVLCHQRKLVLPPGFEKAYFTPGRGCHLFEYHKLKIATLICYDAEFPETVRHVAQLGADLVLVPTALGSDWSWVAHTMIPTRAYENGVYLAYANSGGVENGSEFLGASVIAAPDGIEVARAGASATIIYGDIDKSRVAAAQKRLPYLKDGLTIDLS
ncbi:(R)-stereoselective amidase (plasmid) [Pseudoseohaeicola sp. NH-UV-7]